MRRCLCVFTLSTAPDTVNIKTYKLVSSLMAEHESQWSDLHSL